MEICLYIVNAHETMYRMVNERKTKWTRAHSIGVSRWYRATLYLEQEWIKNKALSLTLARPRLTKNWSVSFSIATIVWFGKQFDVTFPRFVHSAYIQSIHSHTHTSTLFYHHIRRTFLENYYLNWIVFLFTSSSFILILPCPASIGHISA